MTDIICECGHATKDHDNGTLGCMHEDGKEEMDCYCELGWNAVDARSWARKMYRRAQEAERLHVSAIRAEMSTGTALFERECELVAAKEENAALRQQVLWKDDFFVSAKARHEVDMQIINTANKQIEDLRRQVDFLSNCEENFRKIAGENRELRRKLEIAEQNSQAIESMASDELDEWSGVEITYVPMPLHTLRHIQDRATETIDALQAITESVTSDPKGGEDERLG